MIRLKDGINFAVLFNKQGKANSIFEPVIRQAVEGIKNWPEEDLF